MQLYTYEDIADAIGVPASTLRVWAQRGKLPDPDYRVGQSPAWSDATIKPWIEENLQ